MTTQIQNLINQLDSLKIELDQLRPIKAEYNKTICQKFQLEFNYHSNHIEGNTLTLGETKNLILRGMEVSIAKKFRDITEMKGHLDAYDTLGFLTDRILTEDGLPLRLDQTFIKNLHKIIFVEDKITHSQDNEIQSITTIPAGEYKHHQNHVMTSTGETFRYCESWQVSQMMQDLLDWYNDNRSTTNSLILASIFHYKFIRIHPFGDGNGRTARLLMNLILQSSGQVIAMIKSDSENKNLYLNALSLVDNNFPDIQDCIGENNPDLFEPFVLEIGNCLLSSYDIMIRSAKGEDILDVLDIIKLAEKREKMKNNYSKYSITEVLADPDLTQQAQFQLDKIKLTIEQYYEKVLNQMFFVNDLNFGRYEVYNQKLELELGWSIKSVKNELFSFIFILSEPKNSTLKYGDYIYFLIKIKFSEGFYNIIIDNVDACSLYYIDIDLGSKLKQLIKAIDDYVVAQTKD